MQRVWEVLGSRWTLGAGGCAGSGSTPARTWRLPESARVAVAWWLRHHSGREALVCGKAFAQRPYLDQHLARALEREALGVPPVLEGLR